MHALGLSQPQVLGFQEAVSSAGKLSDRHGSWITLKKQREVKLLQERAA